MQGMKEFVVEMVNMGRLRHKHLVHLLGYYRWKGELQRSELDSCGQARRPPSIHA
ncbi:Probable L-type lectin-domain containing receptor kinase II.1 [Linum perenne]